MYFRYVSNEVLCTIWIIKYMFYVHYEDKVHFLCTVWMIKYCQQSKWWITIYNVGTYIGTCTLFAQRECWYNCLNGFSVVANFWVLIPKINKIYFCNIILHNFLEDDYKNNIKHILWFNILHLRWCDTI